MDWSSSTENTNKPKGREFVVSELQILVKKKSLELGFLASWWSKPDSTSFADRLYIKNNIQIDGRDSNISVYYLFEDPANLQGFSIKLGSKDMLDRDTFTAVREQVTAWLSPLTDFIQSSSGLEANKKPKPFNITIPKPQNSDDIPF